MFLSDLDAADAVVNIDDDFGFSRPDFRQSPPVGLSSSMSGTCSLLQDPSDSSVFLNLVILQELDLETAFFSGIYLQFVVS
ncbi:hypothetical protein ACH5RR_006981 [Cinchona calisaya]|uniref:Uncharacterized protein n=1 Tax=Cinchona calisaya TaxID=153742 RepID=A0ABD3AQJ1_9GENT